MRSISFDIARLKILEVYQEVYGTEMNLDGLSKYIYKFKK